MTAEVLPYDRFLSEFVDYVKTFSHLIDDELHYSSTLVGFSHQKLSSSCN